MNKLTEIRKALEEATPDWYDNGNEIVSKRNPMVGIGGFLKEEDNHLASNAQAYITYLLQLVETQRETLKWYGDKGNYDPDHLSRNGWIPIDKDEGQRARKALKEISQ